MQTPDEFKTALDLYKFAAGGANTLWTFFSTIGLAVVTFAFGEKTTVRGRGKLALAVSFLVFALVNNYLIFDKQRFATHAWEVMKGTVTCDSSTASLYNQVICAAQPMDPLLVRVGHFAMTLAILGGIYLAHRRDHSLISRNVHAESTIGEVVPARTFTAKQRFSIVGDLLYPAALGAGIAWWVEALVHWQAHEQTPRGAGWALTFGAFFILYHSRSFIILRDDESHREEARRNNPQSVSGEYPWQEFVKDVTDCAALVLAFVSLRLADGRTELLDPTSAFIVAALIPFAAIITQGTLKPKPVNWSWPLRTGSFGVAFAGAVYAYSQHLSLFIPSRGDWAFLGALLLLLFVYLFWPQHFGARTAQDRAPQIQSFGSVERGGRAIGAVIALMAAAIYVWIRIMADPSS